MTKFLVRLLVTTVISYCAGLCYAKTPCRQLSSLDRINAPQYTTRSFNLKEIALLLQEPQSVLWERKLTGNDKLWQRYRALTVTNNGEVLIALTKNNPPTPQNSQSSQLVLWRLRANGEIINETTIVPPTAPDKNAALADFQPDIFGLTALENGEVVLIVEFSPRTPLFVKVDKAGKQVLTKEIVARTRYIWTNKLLPTTDGNLLLIGHESLDALVIKIDGSGKTLWEKKDDRGAMDFFVDGIPLDKGSFVLIGNTGRYDVLRRGDSRVWLSIYEANGTKRTEKFFAGRFGNVARSSKGTYALIYDKEISSNQSIVVKSLNPALEVLWESQIVTTAGSYSDFKILPLPTDGFVVAGDKNGHPYAARIRADGTKAWAFARDNLNKSMDIGLAISDGEIIIVSSIYAVEDTKSLRQIVWATKLTAS